MGEDKTAECEVLCSLQKFEDNRHRYSPGAAGCGKDFDCNKMELGQERRVRGSGIIVVEGACSCHPKFGEHMTVRAFCDVHPKAQLCHVAARDGELYLEIFRKRWIPMEEAFFAAYSVKERADIVI